MGPITKSFRLEAPVILGIVTGGPSAMMMGPSPPASQYPNDSPDGDSKEADPKTVQKWMLSYPKLDAPLDWSPLTFKPASLKLSTGAAATPADDDGDAEDYFRKSGL
mmetsp:Transcript_926/g.2132  ORF Transcript_926/g.2132 Transcript_926/m.2132 type:complete len:107 (+) Transcript_926:1662-1982(+)